MTLASNCDSDSHLGKGGLEEIIVAGFECFVVREVLDAKVAVITAFTGVATFKAVAADSAATVGARLLRLSVQC